jgi:osmotically-inducible protein OsmY
MRVSWAMRFFRALAAFILAASLGSASAQGPVRVDDQTLLVQVEDALSRAHSIAAADIRVHIREGVVTLTGFADTFEQALMAGSLAHRVRGVSAVHNGIRIPGHDLRA